MGSLLSVRMVCVSIFYGIEETDVLLWPPDNNYCTLLQSGLGSEEGVVYRMCDGAMG